MRTRIKINDRNITEILSELICVARIDNIVPNKRYEKALRNAQLLLEALKDD